MTVYQSGQEGYSTFRIPAIVKTTSDTLLAFAEGRKHGRSDTGDIDLVLRRSRDHGRTWGPLQIIWNDGENTCGNPAPVVDTTTGRILLLSTWNRGTDLETMIHDGVSSDTRRVFATHSDDDGASFATPREITTAVKQPDWRWYATGPCHAIQLDDRTIIIPANHSGTRDGKNYTSSHAIISDDHGKSWRHGAPVGGHTNESTVAQLDNGDVYINMRSYRGKNLRAWATSTDKGETWSEPANDPVLIEPVCQASVLRHRTPGGASVYYFSNPASKKRERMTIRVSHDQCKTWSAGRLIHAGPSAYSDLCSINDETIALLYERNGDKKGKGRIDFVRIPIKELLP